MKASVLIASAKRDAPRRDLETEVLGTLGVAAVLAPSLGGKLWAALKHAAVSKIGVSSIAIVAASGGYVAGRLQERALHHHEAPAVVVMETREPALTPTPSLTPTQTATATPTPMRTSAGASTSTSKSAPPPPPPPPPSLSAELASIKSARESLLARDGHGAIDALDDYDRKNPNGMLAEEALALRVRADRLVGDDVGAAEALTKLETRFPNSVHLATLRK